jgi:hypothetical protein
MAASRTPSASSIVPPVRPWMWRGALVGVLLGGGLLAVANAGIQLDVLSPAPGTQTEISDLPGGSGSVVHRRTPRALTGGTGGRGAVIKASLRPSAFSPFETLGDWRADAADTDGQSQHLAPDPVEDTAFTLTQRGEGFGSGEVPSSGSRASDDAGAMGPSGSAMSSGGGGGGGLGSGGNQGADASGFPAESDTLPPDLTAATAPGPVPEPETWTLLVLGAGLAGATLRGRARSPV